MKELNSDYTKLICQKCASKGNPEDVYCVNCGSRLHQATQIVHVTKISLSLPWGGGKFVVMDQSQQLIANIKNQFVWIGMKWQLIDKYNQFLGEIQTNSTCTKY